MMTIDDLMLAALVAHESTIYVEIEGKKYRDWQDIARDYQGRKIRGFSVRLDHGVELHLDSEDKPLGTWIEVQEDFKCCECGEVFSDELRFISRSREPGLPGHCPGCGFPMKTKEAKQ